jgi:hypothetical protein
VNKKQIKKKLGLLCKFHFSSFRYARIFFLIFCTNKYQASIYIGGFLKKFGNLLIEFVVGGYEH